MDSDSNIVNIFSTKWPPEMKKYFKIQFSSIQINEWDDE